MAAVHKTGQEGDCQGAQAPDAFPPPDPEIGDDQPEKGPMRRCVVTREHNARERMIRFVVGPDRVLVPDLSAKLPGRGIWLSARGDVLEAARARNVFARAARGPVTVPPDLAAMLADGLCRRIVDTLGLARRAGQAVAGYQKAQGWVQAARAALVVQAQDGSADECARFLGTWAGPVIRPLPGDVLGAAFGRDRVVHAAILPGRLAQALIVETERLAGLSGRHEATQ